MIDWRQWHNEPILVDGLVLIGWLYALLTGPLRGPLAPGQPGSRAEAVCFYSGLAIFYLAVGSPLDRIGRLYLLSAHIVLQMTIVFAAAGLLLRGLPVWMIDSTLGRSWGKRPFQVLVRPLVAGGLFVLIYSAWYVPRLFEWAQRSESGRVFEHVLFCFIGILFWWPLLSRSRVFPPLAYGSRMVYLFCLEVAMTAVFSYLLMAEHPLYPTYELAPRLIAGVGAEDDQMLGGILLSAVSSLVLVGALGMNFRAWARKS